MSLLFIVLAGICFWGRGYQSIFFLAMGIACAHVVSLGVAEGARRACGFAVRDAQKRGMTSAALAIWAASAVLLSALGFGLFIWTNELKWVWMAAGGVLWVFTALGGTLCSAAGKRVAWGILLGLSICGCLGCILLTDGYIQLMGIALSLGVPGLAAWIIGGRLGKFSRADIKRLLIYGRPSWFVGIFGGLPLAFLAWRNVSLLPVYLLSVAWMEYAVSLGRLDDQGSERHLALSVLVLSAPLALAPWIREWLGMPAWFMLMPVWAVSIAHIPVIEGRIARYAWVATLFLAGMAGACFLPIPQGGIAALILLGLLLIILRPGLYAFWLPIRAKFVRKKRR